MQPDSHDIVSPTSRKALLHRVRARVRRAAKSTSPDGEWASMAFVVGRDGAIKELALRGADWVGDFLAAAVPLSPRAACVATTALLSLPDEDEQRRARIDPQDVPRASERVRRSEYVLLYAADRSGLSTQIAAIKRSEHQAPRFGVFEVSPEAPAVDAKIGRAFTALFGPGWLGGGAAANELASAAHLKALQEHLAQMGCVFDRDPFCAFVPVGGPQRKTIAVISCEPAVYELSGGRPTGLAVEGIEVEPDVVLRVRITLFDDPRRPAVFAPILNPTADGARQMIGQLAKQPIWEFVFLNSADGSAVGTRYLPVDESQRDALRDLLVLTDGREEPTLERWQEIAARLSLR